jgi:hypothetical protein
VFLLQLIREATDMASVMSIFLNASRSICQKIAPYESQARMLLPIQPRIESLCIAGIPFSNIRGFFSMPVVVIVAVCLTFVLRHLNARSRTWHGKSMPPLANSVDVRACASASSVLCVRLS